MTRALRFVTHNWPLKIGAVALASLLYSGLVLSQSTVPFLSPIPIDFANEPSDVIVLSNPGSVTRIDYVAPADLRLRIEPSTFRAFVDLSDVDPTGGPVTLPVRVETVDPRVQVLDYEPGQIVVTVDRVDTKTVPVRAVIGSVPPGLEIGEESVEPASATVSGPQSIVATITEVQAPVTVDASGIDIDQLVSLVPVDETGTALPALTPVDVEPARARVRVPIFTDRRSKTVPVRPNILGGVAPGFEIASVVPDPPVVSVEGDANDLAGLDHADTAPISVAGASSTVTQTIGLALPEGVQALGTTTVRVTIELRPVTATRTFEAGLELGGERSDLRYLLSTDRVLLTIGGSVADLDRLSATNIVLTIDVAGLGLGQHSVPVTANLNTGLSLLSSSPSLVDVTISSPATSPQPTAGPSPTG
jgi:YbbR domain-containing protein